MTPTAKFTFGELLEKSEAMAGAMQAMGLRHGERVGILMGNDEKWLALFYGAALIGAVTVPVNTRFKAAEIDFCLKQAECKALFYVERFLNIDFGAMVRQIGFSPAVEVSAGLPSAPFKPVPVEPQDLLLIQFTSGTTAYPKGAMLTHDSMLRDAWAAGTRPLVEHDRDLLKRAMRAFRKRLRLTTVDAESTVGRNPMSGARSSAIQGVSPPRDFPREIWLELARQGRLRNAGQGIFELPPGKSLVDD